MLCCSKDVYGVHTNMYPIICILKHKNGFDMTSRNIQLQVKKKGRVQYPGNNIKQGVEVLYGY